MPELPEVEVLVRHLQPLLRGKRVQRVTVGWRRVVSPGEVGSFAKALEGAEFTDVSRRAKYLVFTLSSADSGQRFTLLGHLGMTGRFYLLPRAAKLPKHAAATFELGKEKLVFEDPRHFGHLTLDTSALARLGPEPLGTEFTAKTLGLALGGSRQSIKVKLLDQSVVAGVGNIYASEVLFRARVSPILPANRLTARQVQSVWRAIREVLREAIRCGSTVPLNFVGAGNRDGLFYFGSAPGTEDYYEERLRVYDRAGQPCPRCRKELRRMVQGGRSTFYCPGCQAG